MNTSNISEDDDLRLVCIKGTFTNTDAIGKVFIYVIIMTISIVANSFVIVIVYRVQRMRIAFNYFIVNLSVSDFLITVFYMPRMLVSAFYGFQWQLDDMGGQVLCKLVPYLHEVLICVIVLSMLSIALERVFAVRYPLRRLITNRIATLIVVAIWFFAMAIRLPMLFGLKLISYKGNTHCFLSFGSKSADLIYRSVSLTMFYVNPLLIMTVLYTVLIVSLKRQRFPHTQISTGQRAVERRERGIVKVLLCVVVAFAVCWALYFFNPILHKYNPMLACRYMFIQYCLAHSNSALTPCTYFLFNENFRKGLRTVLSKCCPGLIRQASTRIGPSHRGSDKNSKQQEANVGICVQLRRIQEVSSCRIVETVES